jgi:simple sugar transport system permease protein
MYILNPEFANTAFRVVIGSWREIELSGTVPFNIGEIIFRATPIILTGLSISFAFKTGLFNIGVVGQFTTGAVAAIYVGVRWTFLADVMGMNLHWPVAVLAGMVVGGIWGAIPGLLKAYRNVNEVVAGIMLNYIGMYASIWFVMGNIFNVTYARAMTVAESAELPTWGLDKLFPSPNMNIGIVLTILAIIVIHIILYNTKFGYEIKAVGFNRDASKYAGVNENKNIALALIISGAIAGLAGATVYLVGGKSFAVLAVLEPQGFTGIAISLLGLSTPIGTFLVGIFYGVLQYGGYLIQGDILGGFKPEIVDVIIATIIYISALSLFVKLYLTKIIKYLSSLRKRKADEKKGGDE